MPGQIPQRRRYEDEDEDEELSEGSSATSSHGSKRIRLASDAVSEASEGDLLPDSYRSEPRHRTNAIVQEKHQPGSIIRIKVKNFVTYTLAEFKCGPSLNMIIGPNGTGKSTLVCAICLGLGWKTNVLGRAKDIGEFVKHGHREAEIEVELAAGPKQRGQNPVIRHVIKREGNKSSWQINGKKAGLHEVQQLVKSLYIQIDNLCQFLPQDRVVEFAQMTPVQLLESTQKAAAPEQMSQWHEELKKLGAERKKLVGEEEQTKENLKQLQKRQDAQRADVERMTERRDLQQKVDALEKCRPAIRYRFEKLKADEMKERKKAAEIELRDLQREVAPSLRSVETKEAYKEQLDRLVKHRKTMVDRSESNARTIATKVDEHKKKVEQCDGERKAEQESNKKRKEEHRKMQQQYTNLNNRLNEEPIAFNATEFNEQIREKQREMRELEDRARELSQSRNDIKSEATQKAQLRKDTLVEIQSLRSQAGQQLRKLERASRDTAKAWSWVQRNQHLFRERIYGPPILECSIKDPKYANVLEAIFQRGDLLAFTATNSEDWRKLGDLLQGGGEGLGLSDVFTRNSNRNLSDWEPPVSREQLASYDLDCWMLDLLSGPEPVLSQLCDNARLHRTGASLRESTEQQFERLKESPIQSWVADRQSYTITRRREYGPNAVSTMVRPVRNASIWTDQGVDSDAERALQQKIREMEVDLQAMEDRANEMKDELEQMKTRRQSLNSEKTEVEREKADRQRAYGEWQALPTRIQTIKEKLAGHDDAQSQFRDRINAINDRQEKLKFERGQFAIDYAIAVSMLRKMHNELFEAELWLIEADSELSILRERSLEVRTMLDNRKREIRELDEQLKKQKDICKRYLAEFQKVREEMEDPEQDEILQEWGADESKTPDDLEAEVESTRQRIELLHEGNPQAIHQYEKRAKEIEKLTEKVTNFEGDLEKVNEDINSIRQSWEPELDALVSEISDAFAHNFEMIGCAGQVGVYKDEDDFKDWSIRIQVKFRENEQLSVLDSHRQSGGERAVSTIFYLMALQSLARSPFRVVDEINQGMDPRNERLVHERMVDIACSENTSQYFLITPKLLNGLKYHERMVVHTIYSGETMPEDNSGLDLNELADLALRIAGKVN